MNKLLLIIFFLLQNLAAVAAPTLQQPIDSTTAPQDRKQILKVVSEFLLQQTAALPGRVTYQIDEIDRRLNLKNCSGLEAYLPSGSQLVGRTTVGVRCLSSPLMAGAKKTSSEHSGRTWSIFIPVQIRLNLNLLISTRQLPLGHTLQEQDITSQEIESSQQGAFTHSSQVVGKVLRYSIGAGQVLRADMLRQPYSITQGQIVQLSLKGNGFSIRSEGVALSNAGEGQSVQVRVGSNRVIGGVARVNGIVEITP